MPSSFQLDSIRVLHVDDDPGMTSVVADFLEREDDRIAVDAVADAGDALDRLASDSFDCIVSDYDMPGMDGVELLTDVRDSFGDLPFILFTGKGSEEIASEAISAGVTDYLQKGTGADQYTVLANRILNATTNYHRKQRLLEYRTAIEAAGDAMYALDTDGHIQMVNREFETVTGRPRSELVGSHVGEFMEVETVQRGTDTITELLEGQADRTTSFTFEWTNVDGETRTYENTISIIEDEDRAGSVGVIRDITTQRQRMQYIDKQNQQLEELTNIISRDLKQPVERAELLLTEARRNDHLGQLSPLDATLEHIQDIATTLEQLTTGDEPVGSSLVDLSDVAQEAWQKVRTEEAALRIDVDVSVWGDQDRLEILFENLFRGTVARRTRRDELPVESASAYAGSAHNPFDDFRPLNDTVRIGPLERIHTATRATQDRATGFYYADEGGDFSEDLGAAISGSGAESPGNVGPWVTKVKEVAIAHGWQIYVVQDERYNCRLEFQGLSPKQSV